MKKSARAAEIFKKNVPKSTVFKPQKWFNHRNWVELNLQYNGLVKIQSFGQKGVAFPPPPSVQA